ncbi:RcnB family protein [Ramlibacter sp. PS3R-8]|uniref:RcnB family protein n=1 Tax=Ramlibacter sp. PS3R-8 TaxID=3133437 RepID=UPI0030ABF28F
MKTSTILCTAIAATMGFSTLASAQVHRNDRNEARQERREDARERVEDRRERVEDRREVREDRRERVEDRAERREDVRDGQRRWANPPAHNAPNRNNYGYNNRVYHHGYNNYSNHGYANGYNRGYAPSYYANTAPRFYRGGYLPHNYRHSSYYVSNWNTYPALYAPPYGYQWVHVGNEFLLVAVTTGLIANLLTF